MKKYEVHVKEYTLVGVSSVFQKFVSKRFHGSLYSAHLSEVILVVKDGRFYHAEIEGERGKLATSFLKKINSGRVNLKREYQNFRSTLKAYLLFLNQPSRDYKLDTIKELYRFYNALIGIAFAAADALDFAEVLDKSKRRGFEKWAFKVRKEAEWIYKRGESQFVPKYLKQISRKYLKLYDPELLQYLFFRELEDFLEKDVKLPSIMELARRKKCFFASQYYPDKYLLKSGRQAEIEIKKRKFFDEKTIDASEITGQTAHPGRISGKVSVILGRQDFYKFKPGNIIVSPMTEPSFLPLMKKARAFVTDDGGVLCHAAIVARELKKPCVIGTKIATKIFKDGDLVEVDANKGIVKKITTSNGRKVD